MIHNSHNSKAYIQKCAGVCVENRCKTNCRRKICWIGLGMLERIYAVHTPSTSLSDGVPGAFLTGANSSSRKVSMIASTAAGKMYK